ncbi:MAG: hypothetical protein AB8B97_11375 [Granulosicoccus sp.]
MSDLSATPNLHNLPLQAHDSQVGLGATSGNLNADALQPAASLRDTLFQPPAASDSQVLDIQPAAGMPADADTHARHILGFVGGS